MMNGLFRGSLFAAPILIIVCITVSYFFSIPYAYVFLGFLGWLVAGHLITIDDDSPGGFSNPEGDQDIWHSSLKEPDVHLP